jgi:hypothetical protein
MVGGFWSVSESKYRGTLDKSGAVLTLESEGPCPQEGGKVMKFKELIELKGPGQKVFTSAREKDGKWIQHLKITSRRKNVSSGRSRTRSVDEGSGNCLTPLYPRTAHARKPMTSNDVLPFGREVRTYYGQVAAQSTAPTCGRQRIKAR